MMHIARSTHRYIPAEVTQQKQDAKLQERTLSTGLSVNYVNPSQVSDQSDVVEVVGEQLELFDSPPEP